MAASAWPSPQRRTSLPRPATTSSDLPAPGAVRSWSRSTRCSTPAGGTVYLLDGGPLARQITTYDTGGAERPVRDGRYILRWAGGPGILSIPLAALDLPGAALPDVGASYPTVLPERSALPITCHQGS